MSDVAFHLTHAVGVRNRVDVRVGVESYGLRVGVRVKGALQLLINRYR